MTKIQFKFIFAGIVWDSTKFYTARKYYYIHEFVKEAYILQFSHC